MPTRLVLLLGLPALGIAFAYTIVSSYLPVLVADLSGPGAVGLLIGAEGLLALVVPFLIGAWSDSTHTRYGNRLPFILVGAGLMVPAVALMPATRSLVVIAGVLAVFFVGYFTYYTPYYALIPDLIGPDARGRAIGISGGLRSAGLLLALAGGGLLLDVGVALPFAVAGVAVVAVTVVLVVGLRVRLSEVRTHRRPTWQVLREDVRLLAGTVPVRRWMVANSLWEAAVAALRTFVVLYFTRGLGFSLGATSSVLALVGVSALVAAPVSGWLSDRYGPKRVMSVAVIGFAVGVTPALVSTDPRFVAAILPVAFAAVVLLTLPFALLLTLLPEDRHGAAASAFGLSRGVGVLAGPLLAGGGIELTARWPVLTFADTDGYAAAFAVCGLALLASVPVLLSIRTD